MLRDPRHVGRFAIRATLVGLVGLAGTVAAVASAGQQSIVEFEVDRPFPVIELPFLQRDRSGSILDFAGKKTVLHVFASW